MIFVGGTGRSGTQILSKVLSKNNVIASIDIELRFLFDPDGILTFIDIISNHWDPFNYDLSVKRLRNLLYKFSTNTIYDYYRSLISKTGLASNKYINLLPSYSWNSIDNYCNDYTQLVDELINNLIKMLMLPALVFFSNCIYR